MQTEYQITADTIAALSGLALAVALRYVPPVAGGWDALDRYSKMLVLCVLCFSVAIALVFAQCGHDSVCVNSAAEEEELLFNAIESAALLSICKHNLCCKCFDCFNEVILRCPA